jgi:hypothetical protein
MNQKNRPLAIFIAILLVLNLFVTFFLSKNSFVKAQPGVEPGEELQIEQIEAGVNAEVNEVPGGPGFIMINPFQFRPRSPSDSWEYISSFLYNPSNEYSSLVAPLNLPHGATITKVTLYYLDNTSSNMGLYLVREEANDKVYMAYTSSNNSSKNASDSSINSPIVDNQSYSYYLMLGIDAGWGTDLLLTNVRIDYAYNSNLPLINK